MAVMTTSHAEGVAFEQKALPVPSSDMMALDYEINGASHPNDPTLDSKNAPLDTPDQLLESSTVVNGTANVDALISNKTSESVAMDLPVDSQPAEDSLTLNDKQSLDAEADEVLADATSKVATETTINDAIESAIEDVAAISSVPPIIEAPESDLRHDATAPNEADSHPQESQAEDSASTQKQEQPADDEPLPSTSELPLHASSLPEPESSDSIQVSTSDASQSQNKQASETTINTASAHDPDVEMSEATSAKVSREREEDNEAGPSPKRAKTDGTSIAVTAPSQNGTSGGAAVSNGPISSYLEKEIIKIVKNAARTKTGGGFRAPVPELWPTIAEGYLAKVSNPIDLGTIAEKLKAKTYPTMHEFYADLQLMEDNTVLFNGSVHSVTDQARQTRKSILEKISAIPAEPSAAPKVVSKPTKKPPPRKPTPSTAPTTTEPPAPRAAAPRRPSKSGGNTFALDPATSMPTIRRDSTKDDSGRPKREIKQPKNRELAYHAVRPKSKKYGPELRFCEEVLTELKKAKHYVNMAPFLEPVDPVALNIPNYFTVIKNPMDISTVSKKLNNGEYSRAADFEKDIRLIVSNCYKFNPVGNPVRVQGENVEQLFNEQWAKKDKYIADHAPTAVSPTSSDGEESEEEIEEPVSAKPSIFTNKLVEEQGKLIALMADKKADPSIVKFQQQVVQMVQQEVNNEKAAADAAAAAAKKVTKKTKAKAPKKAAAPTKKSGGGGAKKKNNVKYMGTFEKEVISSGIQNLPEDVSAEVMQWISEELPDAQSGDGEMELDIETISVGTLWRIYELISEYSPETEVELRASYAPKGSPEEFARPAPKKKNKPMSKHEQERKIQALQQSVQQFEQRQSSGSQEPVMPTVEQDESSGDEESDDSEEE